MGISGLKRLLQPYGSTVWFGNAEHGDDGLKQITSVVIDGPSLVYHVHFCLLSRMEERFNPVDAQPSSDEVSIGTMRFLLYLRDLNVTVEKICFDGALPPAKRPTRLSRMEASRVKLQTLCYTNPTGFHPLSIRQDPLDITAQMVFGRGHSAATIRKVPANPFMVPAVIEDLKYRWNWKTIKEYVRDEDRYQENPENFPWAGITHIVPGEADIYTAEAAKVSRAPVLTGDSDFLVHDLGPGGGVIFLDSIETVQIPGSGLNSFRVRATKFNQELVAKKCGISNLQRLAFELKTSPNTSLLTLVQRCKEYLVDEQPSDSYRAFLREYEAPAYRHTSGSEDVILDPKLLELCLQYEIRELRCGEEPPRIYLPFLTENYARRCAWSEGREIRRLGYSLFDMAFPKINLNQCVLEYYRKGDRISSSALGLLRRKDINGAVEELLQRVKAVGLGQERGGMVSWKTFALIEIWRPFEKNNNQVPDPTGVRQFLNRGYVGSRLDWESLHLNAQVQAVLYSIKVLKDLAAAALPRLEGHAKAVVARLLDALSNLPPLRILTQSRCDSRNENREGGRIDSSVKVMSKFLAQEERESDIPSERNYQSTKSSNGEQDAQSSDEAEFRTPKSSKTKKRTSPMEALNQGQSKRSINMYDILGDTA
ncbi:hypothetical protein VTO42DRAFT_8621 [Malbranchea cinnamomea]